MAVIDPNNDLRAQFKDNGTLRLTHGFDHPVVEIPAGFVGDLVHFIIDGKCPFCGVRINQGEMICCNCLKDAETWHGLHCLCEGGRILR